MGEPQRPDVGRPACCLSWLEALVDLSPDLMCLAGVDGYFKRVNPAFERTLGYAAEEFVSRPMIDFVHPEDRERTRTAQGILAGGDELHQFENRCICRDGSVRWLQWNCRPGLNADGVRRRRRWSRFVPGFRTSRSARSGGCTGRHDVAE